MFYGVIQEEYLYEFNFKDTIANLKKKIKAAILAFINKIEGLLNKGKDNKIKQLLRSLLEKVKKLLGVTEKAENKEDLEEVTNELNDYRKEFEDIDKDIEDDTFRRCLKEKEWHTCRHLITINLNNAFHLQSNEVFYRKVDQWWYYYKKYNPEGIGNDNDEEFEYNVKYGLEYPMLCIYFEDCEIVSDKMYNGLKKVATRWNNGVYKTYDRNKVKQIQYFKDMNRD